MVDFTTSFLVNTWQLIAEMAPYLLFGFAVAGLLHLLIRREWVQRWLGKPGLSGVAKASVIGVPMPLCSCSVIPVAASLHKSGASKGATASFLSSTPQTGIDSILATYALMGGLFTTVRVAVAFISGLVSGLLVDIFTTRKTDSKSPSLSPTISLSPTSQLTPAAAPDFNQLSPLTYPQSKPSPQVKHSLRDALRYGLITLPADLAKALILGLLLAGLITTLLPENWISGHWSSGPLSFLLATAISLPLYVCATASIPMAYALIAAGLSPGAALIFLIMGPATNTATVVAVWQMLGRAATLTYLGSLLAISWIAAWLFNLLNPTIEQGAHLHAHCPEDLSAIQHLSASSLICLLLVSLILSKRKTKKTCCAG